MRKEADDYPDRVKDVSKVTIGVHTGTDKMSGVNYGTLITLEI